jgi:hypothetical protein
MILRTVSCDSCRYYEENSDFCNYNDNDDDFTEEDDLDYLGLSLQDFKNNPFIEKEKIKCKWFECE